MMNTVRAKARGWVQAKTAVADTWRGCYTSAIVLAAVVVLTFTSLSSAATHSKDTLDGAKQLVVDGVQWGITAQQDNDPILAVTHAAYAHAHVDIARMLVGDAAIMSLTNIDARELVQRVQQQQQECAARVQPKVAGSTPQDDKGVPRGTRRRRPSRTKAPPPRGGKPKRTSATMP